MSNSQLQNKYAQCTLEKKTKEGKRTQTSWLPLKFAKQNKYLKLKEDGEWEDGWQVVHVGTVKKE
jgi:uncharacterized protein YxeA